MNLQIRSQSSDWRLAKRGRDLASNLREASGAANPPKGGVSAPGLRVALDETPRLSISVDPAEAKSTWSKPGRQGSQFKSLAKQLMLGFKIKLDHHLGTHARGNIEPERTKKFFSQAESAIETAWSVIESDIRELHQTLSSNAGSEYRVLPIIGVMQGDGNITNRYCRTGEFDIAFRPFWQVEWDQSDTIPELSPRCRSEDSLMAAGPLFRIHISDATDGRNWTERIEESTTHGSVPFADSDWESDWQVNFNDGDGRDIGDKLQPASSRMSHGTTV